MAASIDYLTQVISIPKADLTFISGTLYELDTNAFRLELLSIGDSEQGIAHVDTHRHNTEVTVGGVTYARSFEIINGYTVEFEDGQYAVRLVGSNNNVFDEGVLVRNQVSVISTNAAGLVTVTSGSGLSAAQDARLTRIEQLNRNKMIVDPVTGTCRVYDDAGVLLMEGPLYEDAAGTIPYRGQGAERRERMVTPP